MTNSKEEVINKWYQSWHNQEFDQFTDIFALNIVYNNGFGAKYFGISQLINFKKKWHKSHTLIEWKIVSVTSIKSKSFVEWYFNFKVNNQIKKYNGVSIILWDNEDRICSVREYSTIYHKQKSPSNKYIEN